MASKSADGKRWVQILETLRPELPGTWTLRGGGIKTLLVREPIGWVIPWIGCSKASSSRLHAGVAPTVWDRLSWVMGEFGLDMADVRHGPRAVEFGTDGDVDVVREFVAHALKRIDELTPEYYANRAERLLDQRHTSAHIPSVAILMAPGWRVVNGNADPLEAIQGCFEWLARRWPDGGEAVPEISAFLDDLAAAWGDGRDAALQFLMERRDRQLADQGYDNPH